MTAPHDHNLIHSLLAALGPTQNNRLLRLHTPLGEDVLLAERMHGTEAVSPGRSATGEPVHGYKIEILALSTNAHLSLKSLIGQPIRLDLLTQQSRTELRPFHGHVTGISLLGSDDGLARYHIVMEPFLHFLGHRRDAWIFQDKTVIDIIDEVLSDYQGQGQLAPQWRWDLSDPSVYPRRSTCTQFEETDLEFISRLLLEEGLFYYFEHEAQEGEGQGGALGQHTMVICDHNGAFQPNPQPLVRFTQSGSASFREDSLAQFMPKRSVASTELSVSSWDYGTVQQRSAHLDGDARINPEGLTLPLRDQPGVYAFENSAQAERIGRRQLEAIQAAAHQCHGQGPLRQAHCGTTFTVSEHPSVSSDVQFVFLRVQHQGRSNINATQQDALNRLLGTVSPHFKLGSRTARADARAGARTDVAPTAQANQSDEPLYQARILAQDLHIPVRAPRHLRNERGDLLFQRPFVHGEQTALVVGLSGPIHTDRDGRIKIQFHWQRGDQSAHRLPHSTLSSDGQSNAPASDASGTWVRVAQRQAGRNWGDHFIPRLGQEVKVSFLEGDIDRPVVTGSVYNGRGQADAQGNQIGGGAARATGNAAAWFPGNRRAGEHEGHAHNAVLNGIKTQALSASQTGDGGYNQLVFDDTPGQARVCVGTTQSATWLSLGHLIQQTDNQRLAKRGHGLELITSAQGALRAGSGIYLSTHATTPGTSATLQPSDSRAAVEQLKLAQKQVHDLTERAHDHNARLGAEPEAKEQPVGKSQQDLIDSQLATDQRGGQGSAASDQAILAIDGGLGTVAAPSRADLVVFGDSGVALATPAHSVFTAGTTASITAGQDINLISQRHTAVVVDNGTLLFTYGQANDSRRPVQDTGIQMHAAQGNVSMQAQENAIKVTTEKSLKVTSTHSAVTVGASKHILLTAGGSAIRLENNRITLTTPSMATFKAAMKELTGPSGGSTALKLPTSKLAECPSFIAMAGSGGASAF